MAHLQCRNDIINYTDDCNTLTLYGLASLICMNAQLFEPTQKNDA